MMMNLFSSFDPSTNLFNMNWLVSSMFLIITNKFWLNTNLLNSLILLIYKILNKEFKFKKKELLILISIFMMIFLNNYFSLFPHIFSPTSHLSFSLSLALPLWMMAILLGWMNNSKKMMIHMIPAGTPMYLIPMMLLIELISNLIRPITLSIRLSANIIAGHLLMSFMSNLCLLSNFSMITMINIQMIYITLEMSISMIQAYIFMLLIYLYMNESK